MKCPNCQASIKENQKFCAMCGMHLNTVTTSSEVPEESIAIQPELIEAGIPVEQLVQENSVYEQSEIQAENETSAFAEESPASEQAPTTPLSAQPAVAENVAQPTQQQSIITPVLSNINSAAKQKQFTLNAKQIILAVTALFVVGIIIAIVVYLNSDGY